MFVIALNKELNLKINGENIYLGKQLFILRKNTIIFPDNLKDQELPVSQMHNVVDMNKLTYAVGDYF